MRSNYFQIISCHFIFLPYKILKILAMKKHLLLLLLIIGLSFSSAQCPPVTQLSYNNYTGTSVDIEWTINGTATIWDVEYGPQGFSQGTGTLVTVQSAPFTIVGLAPNSVIDVYVRSECGNQFSSFAGPLLVPGNYNLITGTITFDSDTNGCSPADPAGIGVIVTARDSSSNLTFYGQADANGDYTMSIPDGNFDLTTDFTNSSISTSPSIASIVLPNAASSVVQDFCLIPTVLQEDIEVRILPRSQARPGFDVSYNLILANTSTLPVSDVLNFNYPSDYMTLLSALPAVTSSASNSLSWSYSLNPLDSIIYELNFNLNPPTHPTFPLNGNDILNLNASTYLTGVDVDLTNNTFDLDQVVVNSYDPNDKTCLQGETIDPAMIGEYLDYLIRFENTGTASAINVRVKDVIDTSKFDINSIVPIDASHEYYMSLTNGNEIEFHFDDINLDFNDATNDGYVLFKIRTLNTLVDGDSFDNTAEIYFDFNFPIITNTETVSIMSTASIIETTDSSIIIYPNPATNFINITSSNSLESVTIMDMNGRLLSQRKFIGNNLEQQILVENLNSGIYFVTIKSEAGQKIEKLIVN